jgi:hypothetical protein
MLLRESLHLRSSKGNRKSATNNVIEIDKSSSCRMDPQLSPWWRRGLILLTISGFSALGYLAARTYQDAPPIPARVNARVCPAT